MADMTYLSSAPGKSGFLPKIFQPIFDSLRSGPKYGFLSRRLILYCLLSTQCMSSNSWDGCFPCEITCGSSNS